MSYNNLERKLHLAIQAVLQRTLGEFLPVHIGQCSDDLERPYVSVIARDGKEMIQDTGARGYQVDISVKSDPDQDADDTLHYEREGAVYDAIFPLPKSLFIAALNKSGIEEFTAQAYREIESRSGVDDQRWFSTLTIEVICSGSILS